MVAVHHPDLMGVMLFSSRNSAEQFLKENNELYKNSVKINPEAFIIEDVYIGDYKAQEQLQDIIPEAFI